MTCDMSTLARIQTTGSHSRSLKSTICLHRVSHTAPTMGRMLQSRNVISCSARGRCPAESLQHGCLALLMSALLVLTPTPVIAAEEAPPPLDTAVDVGTSDTPTTSGGKDVSLAETIQWLNSVTGRATDELNEIHPPPLKDLVANAGSSNVVQEIEGVTKVFGNVASDLKDGFVGLKGTIQSLGGDQNSQSPPPVEVEPVENKTTTTAA